jgi:hypothetical protein
MIGYLHRPANEKIDTILEIWEEQAYFEYVFHDNVNTSGKASAQIPQLPLGDDSPPWGR